MLGHLSEFLLFLGSCKSWLKSFQCLQAGFFPSSHFITLLWFVQWADCSAMRQSAVAGSGTLCILLLQPSPAIDLQVCFSLPFMTSLRAGTVFSFTYFL